ncbi:glycosyltransferase family 4 protein [Agarivorans gilvus]|uniref:Glycosyl transferase family 1 n=1 Tax=Agarivorans gilvus TaxID=680279 RepID=A0ABQ1I1Y6_9ALTE|nr:glycosyltransferase family 4 protein [Agarivorans gilvus]GGB08776.1 glycosyl transferase family 1 [Agarivorans gilvus]
MKVVHLVSSLNLGGAERLVYNLALEQQKLGIDVTVMSSGKKSDTFYSMLQAHNIDVVLIEGAFLQRLLFAFRLLRKFNIVHFHSIPLVRSLSPIIPCLVSQKVIFTVHGETSPKALGMRLSLAFSRLFMFKVLAVSEAIRHSLKDRFNYPVDSIGLIANGVPIAKEIKPFFNTRPLRLGFVGRLIPLKNVPMIIEALSILDHSSVELNIFGDGECRGDLECLASKKGVNTIFHGNEPNQEKIYRTFDLLIISSNTEGLPMVLLESMSRGIPVVSTNVGAISTVVKHKKNGYLIEVGDEASLSKIIRALLLSPEVLSSWKKASYDLVQQEYSIEKIAKRYLELYK